MNSGANWRAESKAVKAIQSLPGGDQRWLAVGSRQAACRMTERAAQPMSLTAILPRTSQPPRALVADAIRFARVVAAHDEVSDLMLPDLTSQRALTPCRRLVGDPRAPRPIRPLP